MRNELIRNISKNNENLNIKPPLFMNSYLGTFTFKTPFFPRDLIKFEGSRNLDTQKRWLIKKAKTMKEFSFLFPIYDNIISPDSFQFFNLRSFEQIDIKLPKMENIKLKKQTGNISEFKEIKKTENSMRFNNKKLYDESTLLDSININEGRNLYFLTDHIFEEFENPNCFIKFCVEPFDNLKIIQFLDLFFLNMKFENLIKEYSRYVFRDFCKESLEISENNENLICCFSHSTHFQRKYLNRDFIKCNIFNSINENKTTNVFLGDDGIEVVKNNHCINLDMFDFSKLPAGIYAWNNKKIYKIGDTGETFTFKGLHFE
ncbi:hypothetical protein CDIK_0433 [Cucumispora dikerogammari]|nr:hypothetical protein CDIK_0433 [Cucumispora dikerogammari]